MNCLPAVFEAGSASEAYQRRASPAEEGSLAHRAILRRAEVARVIGIGSAVETTRGTGSVLLFPGRQPRVSHL